MLQEITLTANASLAVALNQTFNDCCNITGSVDHITQRLSLLWHPVGALATFDRTYTAPGCYWVSVWAHRVVPGTNKSDLVTTNLSVIVTTRPTLMDETGLIVLLVPNYVYVDEPLHLTVLIQNHTPDINMTVHCEDDPARWSISVVETSSKTTLQEAIERGKHRNRYRVMTCSRSPSTNADKNTTMFFSLDVVHRFSLAGNRRITLTVRRTRAPEVCDDQFIVSTGIQVRRRPSLSEELGAVLIAAREPVYVNESVEFVYAVQRPHPDLEYRLDFGDGLGWSTVTVNRTILLPGWVNSSHLELDTGELLRLYQLCDGCRVIGNSRLRFNRFCV